VPNDYVSDPSNPGDGSSVDAPKRLRKAPKMNATPPEPVLRVMSIYDMEAEMRAVLQRAQVAEDETSGTAQSDKS